jgi:predicted  nucleic acid-binding Zn-ribbon protein
MCSACHLIFEKTTTKKLNSKLSNIKNIDHCGVIRYKIPSMLFQKWDSFE